VFGINGSSLCVFCSETNIVCAAVLLIHHLCRKPILTRQFTRTPYPHVEYSGDGDVFGVLTTFTVYVNGVAITECHEVTSALTICFLCYWIFNIQYCSEFLGVLSFMDNFIFKKNTVPMSRKVTSFINKL
jgi:hypothetical protein